MEMCICGHLEREHDPTGECRAAGCRCKHFKPEIRLPSSAAGLADTDAPTAPGTRQIAPITRGTRISVPDTHVKVCPAAGSACPLEQKVPRLPGV
jgi:hypothetical protein